MNENPHLDDVYADLQKISSLRTSLRKQLHTVSKVEDAQCVLIAKMQGYEIGDIVTLPDGSKQRIHGFYYETNQADSCEVFVTFADINSRCMLNIPTIAVQDLKLYCPNTINK